jgi:hypothetical protein
MDFKALYDETYAPKVQELAAWLETDPWAKEWAKGALAGDARAAELGALRAAVTNQFLKPFVKAMPEDPDAARAWLAQVDVLGLVKATLPFDRANAVFVMKIDRTDEACPRGFLWVTDAALAKLNAELAEFKAQPVQWTNSVLSLPTAQRPSVASAYVRMQGLGSPELDEYLRLLTETAAPEWLHKEVFRPLEMHESVAMLLA